MKEVSVIVGSSNHFPLMHEAARDWLLRTRYVRDLQLRTIVAPRDWDHVPGSQIDGALVFYVCAEVAAGLTSGGIRTINLAANQHDLPFPQVVHDHEAAGKSAAEHLAPSGSARVHYLTLQPDSMATTRRVHGAAGACRKAGVRFTLEALPHVRRKRLKDWWREVETKIGRWLDRIELPASVICDEAQLALRLMRLGEERGILTPGDMRLILMDTPESGAVLAASGQSLSHVPLDWRGLTHQGLDLLSRWVLEGEPPPVQLLTPPLPVVSRSSTRQPHGNEVLHRAYAFLDKQTDYGLTAEEWARGIGVAPVTLYKHFSRSMNCSTQDALKDWRMQHARNLLHTSAIPVAGIAELLGFSSASSFTYSFRQAVGTTPAMFRRESGRQAVIQGQ